jgi:ABC-type sulfate/molybdate transport systems ATPase subunit
VSIGAPATRAAADRAADGAAPGLSVAVRRRLPAFALDVAFEVGGGVTALLGPSGAGKSLTLRAIAGLLRPDGGRVAVGGRVLFDAACGIDLPARERRVGYVFQQYGLFPHLTVAENVGYGLHARTRAERRARVGEVLDLVGLAAFAGRRPRELSGGQQQRVALARALAPEPAVLLLDEPLSALDVPLRRRLGDELRALHERTRTPMVLVTHDPDEAARVADAVVRVDGGRASPGPPHPPPDWGGGPSRAAPNAGS